MLAIAIVICIDGTLGSCSMMCICIMEGIRITMSIGNIADMCSIIAICIVIDIRIIAGIASMICMCIMICIVGMAGIIMHGWHALVNCSGSMM